MSEKSNFVTVSTSADYLIGYERILDYFKQAQKECPKGVGLKKDSKAKGSYTLQFKLGDKRVNKTCGCYLTMQGFTDALRKAHLVATALESFSSETQFLSWYDDVILEKNIIKNDLITFGDAIAKVEKEYWDGRTKRRQRRDTNNASHQSSWRETYNNFYKLLPPDTIVNLPNILSVLNSKKPGTKSFKGCLCAMKKLAETIGDTNLLGKLKEVDGTQTEFREDLQTLSLEDFLTLREQVLNVPLSDKRYKPESRKRWLWVFSMQLVYGFRVHEVFAIQNIDKPFKTKDGITIPPLNEPANKKMIAVVGEKTLLDTTTKTGYRLCVLMLPPTHFDLIECLEIKLGKLPEVHLLSSRPETVSKVYAKRGRDVLVGWDKGFTQTHALRHLANLSGQMAGMSQETRAKSLGHSAQMNEGTYKKRANTKTTIDLLTQSTTEAIPLGSAIEVLKQLGSDGKSIRLLAAIYGITPDEVMELLAE